MHVTHHLGHILIPAASGQAFNPTAALLATLTGSPDLPEVSLLAISTRVEAGAAGARMSCAIWAAMPGDIEAFHILFRSVGDVQLKSTERFSTDCLDSHRPFAACAPFSIIIANTGTASEMEADPQEDSFAL